MDDNHEYTEASSESILRFLVLGGLESALNQALSMDPEAPALLARLAGTVIRVRSHSPSLVFYITAYEDGVDVLYDHPGEVDIRIRGAMGALISRVLVPEAWTRQDSQQIRISGNEGKIQDILALMETVNLWHALQLWLKETANLDELLATIRREDPVWMERLRDVPSRLNDLLDEMHNQQQIQKEILNQVKSLKENLRSERRTDIICLTAGIFFLFAAISAASGQLDLFNIATMESPWQVLILATTGLTLLLSRLFGKRYEEKK